jgi:hypothetical protein
LIPSIGDGFTEGTDVEDRGDLQFYYLVEYGEDGFFEDGS